MSHMESNGSAGTSPVARFLGMPVEASFKRTATGGLAVYPWPLQVGCILPDDATGASLRGVMTLWLWAALPAFILIGMISPHALLPLGAIYVGGYYLRVFIAMRGLPRISGEFPDENARQSGDGAAALIGETRYDESEGGYMPLRFFRGSLGIDKGMAVGRRISASVYGGIVVRTFRLTGLILLATLGLWVALVSGDLIGVFIGLASAAFFGGFAYPALRLVRSKSNQPGKVSEWQARRAVLTSAAHGYRVASPGPTVAPDEYDSDVAIADDAGVYRTRTRPRLQPARGASLPNAAPAPTGARRLP
jgi:hypothetical protein